MAVPKGGRGHKAPYETTHVRVPVPIKEEVERLILAFKDDEQADSIKHPIDLAEATVLAKKILSQKKSARVSMENLLTAIYGVKATL